MCLRGFVKIRSGHIFPYKNPQSLVEWFFINRSIFDVHDEHAMIKVTFLHFVFNMFKLQHHFLFK